MNWRFGLIGYPLSHSLSPRLHRAALAGLNLAGEYQLRPVSPDEADTALPQIVDELRCGHWLGVNITIPYKTRIIPLVDVCDPQVQALGAANTLIRREGKIWAENTDLPAFKADLSRNWPEIGLSSQKRLALILGAGGAARAAAAALLQDGWQVTVAARRIEQGWALQQALAAFGEIHLIVLRGDSAFQQWVKETSLLVNATPVGMWPDWQDCPWPEGIRLPPAARVMDLIYNPPETRFIRLARQAGLIAWNGLGMLVEQAALALEHWLSASAVHFAGQGELIRHLMHQAAQEFVAAAVNPWEKL